MKRVALLISLLFLAGTALAHGGSHSGLPEPGHLPGSLMYKVDQLSESVSLFFTFSKKEKMEKKVKYAKERLAESVKLMEENRTGKAAELAQKYSQQMKSIGKEAKQADLTKIRQKVEESLNQSREVLEGLKTKLPEAAQKGIQTALSAVNDLIPGNRENRSGRVQKPANPPSRPGKDSQVQGYVATGKVIQSGRK